MLRQGLASDAQGGPENCPDAASLAAYYERSLTASESAVLDAHLAMCSRCRGHVAALVRSEAPEPERPERSVVWLWDWRVLTPAMAAVAIAIISIGVWEHRHNTAQPVIVAMNRAEKSVPAAPPIGAIASAPANPAAIEATPKQAPSTAPSRRAQPAPRLIAPIAKPAPPPPAPSEAVGADEITAAEATREPAPATGVVAGVPSAQATPPSDQKARSVAQSQNAPVAKTTSPGGSVSSTAELSVVPRASRAPAERHAAPVAAAKQAMPGAVGGLIARPSSTPREITIVSPDFTKSWRITSLGAIEFSNDSGQTWVTQTSVPAGVAVAGSAPSVKVCWVVGRGGFVLRAKNGSEWKQVTPPVAMDLIAIRALDAKHATVTAADGSTYVTKDGGKSWEQQKNP